MNMMFSLTCWVIVLFVSAVVLGEDFPDRVETALVAVQFMYLALQFYFFYRYIRDDFGYH